MFGETVLRPSSLPGTTALPLCPPPQLHHWRLDEEAGIQQLCTAALSLYAKQRRVV